MKTKIILLFIWVFCVEAEAQNYFGLSAETIIYDLRVRVSHGEVITVKDLKTQEIQSDSLIDNDYVSGMKITIGQSVIQEIYFDEYLVCDSMIVIYYDPFDAELELNYLVSEVKRNWIKINNERYVSPYWSSNWVSNPNNDNRIAVYILPQLNIIRSKENDKTVFIYSELETDEKTWKELKKNIVNPESFKERDMTGVWEVCVEFKFNPNFTCDSGKIEYSFVSVNRFFQTENSDTVEGQYEFIGSLLFLHTGIDSNYLKQKIYQVVWINENSFYSVHREWKHGPKLYTYFTRNSIANE